MKGEKILFQSLNTSPEDCTFCKIVRKELPSYTIYQDDEYIAFLDINPIEKGHTLVCPKRHGETMWDMSEKEIGGLFAVVSRLSRAIVSGMDADGFRLIQNNGEAANQIVAHVHVHIIPTSFDREGARQGRVPLQRRLSFPQEIMQEVAGAIRAAVKG